MSPEAIVRMGISMDPGGGGIIRELTVDENLRAGAPVASRRADLRKALDEVMALFRIGCSAPPPAGKRIVGRGERQMLAVGRALMSRAELLLLDEPSLGWLPRLSASTACTIYDLRAKRGLSVLLVGNRTPAARSRSLTRRCFVIRPEPSPCPAGELAHDEELWHAYSRVLSVRPLMNYFFVLT